VKAGLVAAAVEVVNGSGSVIRQARGYVSAACCLVVVVVLDELNGVLAVCDVFKGKIRVDSDVRSGVGALLDKFLAATVTRS
jgi:hypothetical protein